MYYFVGEGNKTLPPKSGGDCSSCFNLYSSPDLASWTFLACVVKNEDLRAAMPEPQFQVGGGRRSCEMCAVAAAPAGVGKHA